MGTTQTQLKNPPTFESVWATLDEITIRQKELTESQKETDRLMKEWEEKWQREADERRKEADKRQKEADERRKEIDRQMKETDKKLGKLGIRMGEIVEHMVAPNLRIKFRELGLNFPQATTNADVEDVDNNIFFEIDVLLQNGDKAMLVEVKTKLTTENVKDHIRRLVKMRKYANLHGDKRTFLGAVAGVVIKSNVKNYALEQGLYVIEPSGETFNITVPNGLPKEW